MTFLIQLKDYYLYKARKFSQAELTKIISFIFYLLVHHNINTIVTMIMLIHYKRAHHYRVTHPRIIKCMACLVYLMA